ncbi:unnamed protein product [Gongylonema pulchrum]|uniref:Rol-3 five-bladed beta-propeller domain-containing protein n=1 Tax=Gongylonema pulchrum TaxID=637853 RepID=A0A183CUV6_9BILA|nr:unnamed protein product [Gongylonema pulchrum]
MLLRVTDCEKQKFFLRIYSCESLSDCGEVGGLAGDEETGDVFYLIRNANGSTSLYALNQDVRSPYLIASSENFPRLQQLIVVNEKFAFVTESGEMGVCDKKLGSLNINLALRNVGLVPRYNFGSVKRINFTRELAADESSARKTLTWATEPMLTRGKVIFKITLYEDQWGGERFVDYSLSHSYTISEALLRQWQSRQRYDAEVEAITAGDIVSINQTGLIAPTKPPTPPTNITIYATQQVIFVLEFK